ncbi:MAG: nuclear transport factor 2 family protein [Acidobacteria bacterium]|nr:nuclear transport factor 2 family protein [Acidobacteriota bacterium]
MKQSANLVLFAVIGMATLLIGAILAGNIGTSCAAQERTVESRLQELEDREEIRQLLKDYGRFLDQRDFASFSQLFAEKEGEWIGGMGQAKRPKAIQKLMEDTIGKNTEGISMPNFHLFTNEIIHLRGNQADATTKWIFVVQGEKGSPQWVYLGHYEDSLLRENGRWKFLKRVVHADIPSDKTLSKK